MKKDFIFYTVFLFCLVTASFIFSGCEQVITRNFGGTTTINLKPGEKLVEATWKDDDIWYLVEPMDSDYIPKTKVLKESSVAGVMEGKIIFIETK